MSRSALDLRVLLEAVLAKAPPLLDRSSQDLFMRLPEHHRLLFSGSERFVLEQDVFRNPERGRICPCLPTYLPRWVHDNTAPPLSLLRGSSQVPSWTTPPHFMTIAGPDSVRSLFSLVRLDARVGALYRNLNEKPPIRKIYAPCWTVTSTTPP
ncbi:uncharacterized protein K489DRAFT_369703 [Dissoconium aciculare CBS 342.82]|uniref:Uncharacterized protein n=1 Tax=Dissoconium aciculare CBS 342.82 TaxID=1314786 RepID=A0A6J3M617_9PEZI|nr:uncharacterized protein K489DRAFT_369703 [Dissoconium aciculare CBS 342.82]KAF1823328.1 hypothetical protein K489DRAFT_369703 [Dissoconium aciculare CBS 342.82]